MEPDPDQTAIDFDSVEHLFANADERLEIVLAAGFAASQNLVVADWLPGLRQGSSVGSVAAQIHLLRQSQGNYRKMVDHRNLAGTGCRQRTAAHHSSAGY